MMRLSAEELRARAHRLLERGELGEAIDVATRATTIAPTEPESWVVLAKLQAIAGHEPEARQSYIACLGSASAHDVEECHAHPGAFATH